LVTNMLSQTDVRSKWASSFLRKAVSDLMEKPESKLLILDLMPVYNAINNHIFAPFNPLNNNSEELNLERLNDIFSALKQGKKFNSREEYEIFTESEVQQFITSSGLQVIIIDDEIFYVKKEQLEN